MEKYYINQSLPVPEYLRRFLDSSPDMLELALNGVIIHDDHDNVIFVDGRAYKLLNIPLPDINNVRLKNIFPEKCFN